MTLLAVSHLSWYIARSGGMIAWVLCTCSILWGLTLSTRLIKRRGAPAWILDMHRFLGTLSIIFTIVHLFGLFIPMHSTWRPGAVAWGITGFYLLVAIQVSSWLMRRLSRKLWHTIHMGSFGLFVFATVHAYLAGHDKGNVFVQWLALTGVTIVLFLSIFRLLSPRRSRRSPSSAVPG